MNRILHTFSTLWIYTRREKYIADLKAEDAALSVRDYDMQKPDVLRYVRHRRAMIAEEVRGLAAPFSWRSLGTSAPAHAFTVMPADTTTDDYARAA